LALAEVLATMATLVLTNSRPAIDPLDWIVAV